MIRRFFVYLHTVKGIFVCYYFDYYIMDKIGILVDFDNIFPRPLNEYVNGEICTLITNVVSIVRNDYTHVDMVEIRLYGGWYTGTSLTARASALGAMMPLLNSIFPILELPSKRINGFVDLATQLYGSTFTWYNTYRERRGIPNLRVDTSRMSETCNSNPEQCPVKILKRFTDKRTRICGNAGCSTNHASVFFGKTQKYVDTMLACDVISYSLDDDVKAVYVLSDDVDIFPSFLVSSELPSSHTNLHLLIMNGQSINDYTSLLSAFNVKVSLIRL